MAVIASENEAEVEAFLRAAESAGVESYKPEEATREYVEKSLENRKTLSADEKAVVQEINSQIQSDEFKEQQAVWRKKLGQVMGSDAWQAQSNANTDVIQTLPYSERPLLFISSSMPMRTLRTYAQSLERVGGAMILRGFVDGMDNIKPTLHFISDILKVDLHCTKEPCARRQVEVLIDPFIFREYGIKAVPAFTVHDITELEAYCKGTEGLNPASVVVYGDNSIEYLAEQFARKSGRSIEQLVKEIKSK